MPSEKTSPGSLALGGLAAVLASTCCLGPLLFASLGLGGAWVGNLRVLEPFRPVFMGVAFVAMFFAWRSIYRPAAECAPGAVCEVPQTKRLYRRIFWAMAGLVSIAVIYPYIAPLFY